MMAIPTPDSSRAVVVRTLKERIRRLEEVRPAGDDATSSSGCAALDRLLPRGGFRRGTLVEWLSAGRGDGAATLALNAARQACAEGGVLVVTDPRRQFYPPAAAALGIDLGSVILIRANNERDQLWALDQSLRCQAVAAVWGLVEKLDGKTFRRLQLAAQSGGSLGLLLRPASVRGQPTWSDVQLAVEPRPSQGGRRLRIEVVRCRGGTGGGVAELEINEATAAVCQASIHETHPLHLATQLVRSAARRRSTGA